jgi:Family of unknown function (DUF6527)
VTGIPLRIVGEPPQGDREPGLMWRYPAGDEAGRECWWIILPNTRNDRAGISWRTTDRASLPPHEMWDVTGTAPALTVHPSIDVEYWRPVDGQMVRDGSYWHGWIRNGELVNA